MNTELLLRQFIAISQKNQHNRAQFPFGEGMNGQIEVTLPFPESQREEYWQDRFKEALSEIDHKSLGLDQNLGFEPSTPAVCRFVFEKMGLPKKAKVAFLRGDGYCALFYGQP